MRDAVGAVTFGPEDAESLADQIDSTGSTQSSGPKIRLRTASN